MDIRTGDYVTLKSIEEVKPFYKFWDVTSSGSVATDTDYFTESMIDAMESSDMYEVVEVTPDDVWIDVEGTVFGFEKKCIKDIYRLTKVS